MIEDIQGMRVLEEDVGTSSISIAREHNVPFLMFGPEMWIKDSHSGDACSAPICVNGKIRYIISFFSLDQNDLPYDLLLSLLLTMKYSIEQHLSMLEYWSIYQLMMNELPVAVYWIGQDEQLKYCNNNAQKRLDGKQNLEDVFLNYEHIPIKKHCRVCRRIAVRSPGSRRTVLMKILRRSCRSKLAARSKARWSCRCRSKT